MFGIKGVIGTLRVESTSRERDNINSYEQRMNPSDLKSEKRSRLSKHPWVSLVVLVVFMLFCLIGSRKLVARSIFPTLLSIVWVKYASRMQQ